MKFLFLLWQVSIIFSILHIVYPQNCQCGYYDRSVNTRIVGGTQASPGDYPWMAHLRFFDRVGGERYGMCGGFLVDQNHVVTAAHCIFDGNSRIRKVDAAEVYLGAHDLGLLGDPVGVKKFYYPSDYKQYDLYNDIAVIELKTNVNFSRTISPICLPKLDDEPWRTLTVAGFGRLGPNSNPSRILMHVTVEHIPKSKCNEMIKDFFMRTNPNIRRSPEEYDIPKVHDAHMCCVDTKTGGDACRGDSGGALMYKTNNRHFAVGIVSGAFDECGDPRTPGFYTIVRKFRTLLRKAAPKAQFCDY